VLEAREPATIPVVTLWLTPEPLDRSELRGIIANYDSIKGFKATRFYDGHYEYKSIQSKQGETPLEFSKPNIEPIVQQMIKLAEDLGTKLGAHATRLVVFASSLTQANGHIEQFVRANFRDDAQVDNIIKTFATALQSLPNQDQAIQQDVAATIKDIQARYADIQKSLSTDHSLIFKGRIPQFLFHSMTLDHIPNEVNVAEFVADPEKTSKGMANLCGVAGLSTQKIKELASAGDTAAKQSYEDHYTGAISGGINEFWTQERYNVHFRIEKEKLIVSISDKTYDSRIGPADRSDGFQWYLSLYSALLNEVGAAKSIVVLLDNPGLEVHADGQRDIKRFLEEKLPSAQVIYVTHSPAMIDPYRLEQIRKVELLGNKQGTKVTKLPLEYPHEFDLLEPLRSAIGASLVSSLMFNKYNVLVEGAADKPILEGAFEYLNPDFSKKVLINGSVAESNALLPRFYQDAHLPFIVFLDSDSSGRQLAKMLERMEILQKNTLNLKNILGEDAKIFEEKDFELEDIVDFESYDKAVRLTYPNQPVDIRKDDESKPKRTKHYEEQYRDTHDVGFSKRRVGETLKQMIRDGKCDPKTVKRLKRVTEAIKSALEEQVIGRTNAGERDSIPV